MASTLKSKRAGRSKRTPGSTALTDAQRSQLEFLFSAGAARVEVLDEYWIHGADAGLSYCEECAEKKVAELLKADPKGEYSVDGGWGIEGDSQAFCETCHKMLSNSFTQYACESEVDHFLGNGFRPMSDDDCYSMERVIASAGWTPWEHSTESEREFYADLNKLGHRILKTLQRSNNELSESQPRQRRATETDPNRGSDSLR